MPRNLVLVLILLPIAVGWLAVAALCAALCRVAARAEDAPLPDERLVLKQLEIWESLSQPTIRDTRRASEEREPMGPVVHA